MMETFFFLSNLLTTELIKLSYYPTTRLAESQVPETTYRKTENIDLYSQH
jgi:hypothetical protein